MHNYLNCILNQKSRLLFHGSGFKSASIVTCAVDSLESDRAPRWRCCSARAWHRWDQQRRPAAAPRHAFWPGRVASRSAMSPWRRHGVAPTCPAWPPDWASTRMICRFPRSARAWTDCAATNCAWWSSAMAKKKTAKNGKLVKLRQVLFRFPTRRRNRKSKQFNSRRNDNL